MSIRIVWGCINVNGSKHSGRGFNSNKIGMGIYEVTYNRPFLAPPAVVLTQNFKSWEDFGYGGGDGRDGCILAASDEAKFKAITGRSDGIHDDRNFTFIAIGER